MVKRDAIQEALEQLGGLRSAHDEGLVEKELRKFLEHRSNLVVAKAAKIARERRVSAAVPDMVAAYRRLMADPARLDKRCEASTEIAGALYELDYTEPEPYLKGLRHVQMEGSFGPPVDVAATLRGICAQGLTRTSYPSALEEVVELLNDREAPARLGAIRALAANGGTAGAVALRLKVLTGDREPEVIGECFAGLLNMPTESAVEFVARYVDGAEAIAEAAILALGTSRSGKAVRVLQEKWKRTGPGGLKKTLLLALASSRSENALAFLIAELEEASSRVAGEILSALAAQRPSASIREKIEKAVRGRKDKTLEQQYRSAFPAEG